MLTFLTRLPLALALSTCILVSCNLSEPDLLARFAITASPASAQLSDSVSVTLAVHNDNLEPVTIHWPGCPRITVKDPTGEEVGPAVLCLAVVMDDTTRLAPGDSIIDVHVWSTKVLANGAVGSYWIVGGVATTSGASLDSVLIEIISM